MTDPAVWRDLRLDFHQLALKYGDRLTPTWRSTPYNNGEHWHVFRPDTDDADRERDLFLSLAKRAGVLLGGGGQINPVFAWLDHLRFKKTYSIGVRCDGDVGEFEVVKIEHPCQASVHCCHDLETDAMIRPHEEASAGRPAFDPVSADPTDPRWPPAPSNESLSEQFENSSKMPRLGKEKSTPGRVLLKYKVLNKIRTHELVAEALGLERSVYFDLKAGRRVSEETYVKAALVIGCSPDDLKP